MIFVQPACFSGVTSGSAGPKKWTFRHHCSPYQHLF